MSLCSYLLQVILAISRRSQNWQRSVPFWNFTGPCFRPLLHHQYSFQFLIDYLPTLSLSSSESHLLTLSYWPIFLFFPFLIVSSFSPLPCSVSISQSLPPFQHSFLISQSLSPLPCSSTFTLTLQVFQRSVEAPSGGHVVQNRESHEQVSPFLLLSKFIFNFTSFLHLPISPPCSCFY